MEMVEEGVTDRWLVQEINIGGKMWSSDGKIHEVIEV